MSERDKVERRSIADLTREDIEALQQEAMLSHEGINDGQMTVTLTSTCLHALCSMALAYLDAQSALNQIAHFDPELECRQWTDAEGFKKTQEIAIRALTHTGGKE